MLTHNIQKKWLVLQTPYWHFMSIINRELEDLLQRLLWKWVASWQNQQNDCAPSEDSDQPGHSPSLIRVFAVRMKKAWVLSYPMSTQRRLWSGWADVQADLSLRWAHMPFCWFCHEAAQIIFVTIICPLGSLSVSTIKLMRLWSLYGPRQANLVLIAYASSEGSGEPAHRRSLARTFAARSYKQWVKRNLLTESQIPGPSEWLGMRS